MLFHEAFADGVKGTRADVAVDHTQRGKRHPGEVGAARRRGPPQIFARDPLRGGLRSRVVVQGHEVKAVPVRAMGQATAKVICPSTPPKVEGPALIAGRVGAFEMPPRLSFRGAVLVFTEPGIA